ncbi:bromodomain protein-3 [Diaporthe amygdali]|uniref:bromodomain protein-3 n=1 Tax=Phomopsis amygdali TaxID=1214568 RepID=UPI0022FEE81B|nr:bromodomain protein-3 [Diaporthe amygdali]KAJ0116670.1 bromodomain protein-3 [Diaporthe amygdali]
MALPSKASPLGPRTAQPSRPATSTTDKINAEIRARSAKKFKYQPWLKKKPVQTSQMLRLRRKYYGIELHFYWQVLNANVMGKKNRSINKFFLEPMTAVATNNPAYDKIVKTPMDFGKIRRNWDQGVYGGHAYGLVSDFDLMIDNSLNYYPRGHRIHNAAKKLRKIYEDECAEWSSWMSKAITIARGDGRELSKSLVEMEEGY